MKKKINKKLTLVKQTITNLNENGMNNAKGGVCPTYAYCTSRVCPQLDNDQSKRDGTDCLAGTNNCLL